MAKHKNPVFKTTEAVTQWIGSIESIVVHTLVFISSFVAVWFGVLHFDRMLLILTTAVSLEAIYLAIFIQMSLNFQSETIAEVELDIDEIQEDLDEMHEEDEKEEVRERKEAETLEEIQNGLKDLMRQVDKLQNR